jgi:nucleotidyltransferase/DNA polymerase involved in DNA repair
LKCPQLRLIHVPTYSVGSISSSGEGTEEIVALPKYSDEIPAYRADGTRLPPNPPDPASNKACLEPYRHASMDIFRLIRHWCSKFGDGILLEKGGLDEAFVDITEEVEQQLIDEFAQKYTMLRDELTDIENEELEGEALENLALYDTSWIHNELDFTGLGENAIPPEELANQDSAADIVEKMRMTLGKLRIWKGAQIAKDLRACLRIDLNFIASIGIASNKMLAKLVSALYKPDKQTRIEPAAISTFMQRVPFEKIRMMGGKMGKSVIKPDDEEQNEEDSGIDDQDEYVAAETTTSSEVKKVMASDLWSLSLSELSDRVGDRQTAVWIHQLIRGHDSSPVTPRSLTKSFMSAKSFRPYIRDWPELHDWVVVLVGELWSRISEEKESSGRWPSTITIHFKSFSKTSANNRNSNWSNTGAISKSCEFPFSSSIPSQATRSHFLSSVFKLLNNQSTALDTGIFPMSRLSVSVSNFKGLEADGKVRATRVDQFFKKKTEETDLKELPAGLGRFFTEAVNKPESQLIKQNASASVVAKKSVFEMILAAAKPSSSDPSDSSPIAQTSKQQQLSASTNKRPKTSKSNPDILKYFTKTDSLSTAANNYNCPEKNCKFICKRSDAKEIQEHSDFHVALKLSRE